MILYKLFRYPGQTLKLLRRFVRHMPLRDVVYLLVKPFLGRSKGPTRAEVVMDVPPVNALDVTTVVPATGGLPPTWLDPGGPWWDEVEPVTTFLADHQFEPHDYVGSQRRLYRCGLGSGKSRHRQCKGHRIRRLAD